MEKRLVKGQDRKLAGVCSGVANYFGWDPTWVRAGWAIATLVYGVGLLAYIVCAIVMPNE
ncbi:MAG: PspC domain-containing protein [Clostridia bacterium]|nr:PspC domain-containing protein [Clostridia bacterium]